MWIVGIDITTTVPEKHFPIMRDRMFPEIVLSRLRQRDEIHTMPVDSHPERSINLVRLTRATGLDKEVMAIFEDVKMRIKRTKNPRITTNIGGVLAYAKRLSLDLQQEKARTEASGKTASPLPRFVVHVFTDGKVEGPQTTPPAGAWPADVMVWFWGLEEPEVAPLKQWATTRMELPEAQLHIVLYSDWNTRADKVFGHHIERPYANADLLKKLGIGPALARH